MCGTVSSLSDNELTVGNSELDMWHIVWGLPRGLGKGMWKGGNPGPKVRIWELPGTPVELLANLLSLTCNFSGNTGGTRLGTQFI